MLKNLDKSQKVSTIKPNKSNQMTDARIGVPMTKTKQECFENAARFDLTLPTMDSVLFVPGVPYPCGVRAWYKNE